MVFRVPPWTEMLFAFPLQQTVTRQGHGLGEGHTVLMVSRGTEGAGDTSRHHQTQLVQGLGKGGAHTSPWGQSPDNHSRICWIFNYMSEVVHVKSVARQFHWVFPLGASASSTPILQMRKLRHSNVPKVTKLVGDFAQGPGFNLCFVSSF